MEHEAPPLLQHINSLIKNELKCFVWLKEKNCIALGIDKSYLTKEEKIEIYNLKKDFPELELYRKIYYKYDYKYDYNEENPEMMVSPIIYFYLNR